MTCRQAACGMAAELCNNGHSVPFSVATLIIKHFCQVPLTSFNGPGLLPVLWEARLLKGQRPFISSLLLFYSRIPSIIHQLT